MAGYKHSYVGGPYDGVILDTKPPPRPYSMLKPRNAHMLQPDRRTVVYAYRFDNDRQAYVYLGEGLLSEVDDPRCSA